jgi:hypothetical protein
MHPNLYSHRNGTYLMHNSYTLYLEDLTKAESISLNSSKRHNAALSIYVFSCLGSTDLETKRRLRMEVFLRGGFECENKFSRHYKTVHRQISIFSQLTEKISIARIRKMTQGLSVEAAIRKIDVLLGEIGLDTLDAMSDHCGISSTRSRRDERALTYESTYVSSSRNIDAGHVIILDSLSLFIPNDTKSDEIKRLIKQLTDYYESRVYLDDMLIKESLT